MAQLSCGGKCAKYTLFVFNFIVTIIGLALLVIGIWFLVAGSAVDYAGLFHDNGSLHLVRAASIIVLVVGVLSLILGILGCWGAINEKTGCLNCYAFITLVLVLGELLAVILAGVFHGKVTAELTATMNKTVFHEYTGYNDSVTQAWDLLQKEMSCCGVEGSWDWQNSWWYKNQSSQDKTVPDSCCVLDSHGDPKDINACHLEAWKHDVPHEFVHSRGCETTVEEWVKDHLAILIGFAVSLLLVELAVVILACLLRSNIGKGYEYV